MRSLVLTSMLVFGVVWAVAADATHATHDVQRVRTRLPARVSLHGGWFEMGSDAAAIAEARKLCAQETPACDEASLAAEQPAQRVFVHAYAIDRMEVSNADHLRCVSAGGCNPPQPGAANAPELPVTMLTFADERDNCHYAGGELPTEAQWEFAARGGSRRAFPWGASWNDRLATFANVTGPSPVDSHSDGKSFFGVLNMAGNVAERVLDHYSSGYEASRRRVDPEGPASGGARVLRGGSYRSPPSALRVTARAAIADAEARPDVGLRCAYAM
jgi:formylglycine-generating enzyme required for sulfatase activity